MSRKPGTISTKEKRFCEIYAAVGDAVQAAQAAGYEQPEKAGVNLLSRDEINAEISRLYEKRLKNARQKAYAGYERIAFGNVNDAVRLLFDGEDFGTSAEGYDLFNVAEIKRPKEGALEIKFFDRLKALEKLELLNKSDKSNTSDFYNAILGGLKNSQSDGDDFQ